MLAERIRKAFDRFPFAMGVSQLDVKLSAAVADASTSDSACLLRVAEAALYRAKGKGRNRVELATLS